ncbi:glycoside hydrolase superfamily [Ilyonectria destructans]|nr:glycoside hydrolase superfamily [Ilyonectria destructans]
MVSLSLFLLFLGQAVSSPLNDEIAGGCVGNILPIERIGFPGLCFQDGPNGINIADLVNVFPSGLTIGSSWDKEFMHELGVAMGQYLKVQSCAKHIVANEQETQRSFTLLKNGTRIEAISSNIDDRTMHELYMWPFMNAIKAGASAAMCSYNRLNQTYACENKALLDRMLKKELGFKGYVISDWFATHSGAKSINAGLDINMPGAYNIETVGTGESYWGGNITTMVETGSIMEDRVDDMIRRIMTLYFHFGQD